MYLYILLLQSSFVSFVVFISLIYDPTMMLIVLLVFLKTEITSHAKKVMKTVDVLFRRGLKLDISGNLNIIICDDVL